METLQQLKVFIEIGMNSYIVFLYSIPKPGLYDSLQARLGTRAFYFRVCYTSIVCARDKQTETRSSGL